MSSTVLAYLNRKNSKNKMVGFRHGQNDILLSLLKLNFFQTSGNPQITFQSWS